MATITISSGIGEQPVAGEKYKMCINDDVYECISYENNSNIYIGDSNLQDYPFEIELGENSCDMNTNLSEGTYHIKLERMKSGPMDFKYLPKVYCSTNNSWMSIVEALNTICSTAQISLQFSEIES